MAGKGEDRGEAFSLSPPPRRKRKATKPRARDGRWIEVNGARRFSVQARVGRAFRAEFDALIAWLAEAGEKDALGGPLLEPALIEEGIRRVAEAKGYPRAFPARLAPSGKAKG
jgi:hypothetical protein